MRWVARYSRPNKDTCLLAPGALQVKTWEIGAAASVTGACDVSGAAAFRSCRRQHQAESHFLTSAATLIHIVVARAIVRNRLRRLPGPEQTGLADRAPAAGSVAAAGSPQAARWHWGRPAVSLGCPRWHWGGRNRTHVIRCARVIGVNVIRVAETGFTIEPATIDQAAGALALSLGALGSLLLVIWQSKCRCRCRIGLSDQLFCFDWPPPRLGAPTPP
jgi:hypothetical protein